MRLSTLDRCIPQNRLLSCDPECMDIADYRIAKLYRYSRRQRKPHSSAHTALKGMSLYAYRRTPIPTWALGTGPVHLQAARATGTRADPKCGLLRHLLQWSRVLTYHRPNSSLVGCPGCCINAKRIGPQMVARLRGRYLASILRAVSLIYRTTATQGFDWAEFGSRGVGVGHRALQTRSACGVCEVPIGFKPQSRDT